MLSIVCFAQTVGQRLADWATFRPTFTRQMSTSWSLRSLSIQHHNPCTVLISRFSFAGSSSQCPRGSCPNQGTSSCEPFWCWRYCRYAAAWGFSLFGCSNQAPVYPPWHGVGNGSSWDSRERDVHVSMLLKWHVSFFPHLCRPDHQIWGKLICVLPMMQLVHFKRISSLLVYGGCGFYHFRQS